MLLFVSYTQAPFVPKANTHFCCILGREAKEEKKCPLVLEIISESLLISQIKKGSCFLPEAKVQLRARKWDPVQNLTRFPTVSYQVTVGPAQKKSQPTEGEEEAAHFQNLLWGLPWWHSG